MEEKKQPLNLLSPSQVLLQVTFPQWGTNDIIHSHEPAAIKQTHNFGMARCSISLINISSVSCFITGKNLPCQRTAVRLANKWLQTERSLAQLLVEGSLLPHLVNLLSIHPQGSGSRTGWVHTQQVQLPDLICQMQTAAISICGTCWKGEEIKTWDCLWFSRINSPWSTRNLNEQIQVSTGWIQVIWQVWDRCMAGNIAGQE